DAAADGIAHAREDDRDRPRLSLEGKGRRGPACQDDVGLQTDHLLGERAGPIDVIAEPPKVDPQITALGPTQAREGLGERGDPSLNPGIVLVARHEHADAPYAAVLLRPRRERPSSRAAEQGNEVAPPDAEHAGSLLGRPESFRSRRLRQSPA